ncbi:MAG TPA: protein-glutamate O-methyltransferase CheR [Ignavibacteriales bacterium]|nr:protein-glutamate O-methyltransferase CheR [Ignavibacteriales bacterium]
MEDNKFTNTNSFSSSSTSNTQGNSFGSGYGTSGSGFGSSNNFNTSNSFGTSNSNSSSFGGGFSANKFSSNSTTQSGSLGFGNNAAGQTQTQDAWEPSEGAFGAKVAPVMSPQTFEQWRSFIYDLCGIYFQDNKKYLLESRLQKRVSFLKLNGYEDYLNYLKTHPNRNDELKYLYEAITINETFFFRNQPQLDALVQSIIPEIVNTRAKGQKYKLRVWSAASSSGEEAYSIAMMFQELVKPKYPNLELEVIGTDINYQVVETAKKGVYREYSIRNTPPFYLKKYFKMIGPNTYEVDPNIKKYCSFKVMNLLDDTAMRQMNNFDVVYCCNVLIYFDTKAKIRVVSHLYNSLQKPGYLFIGYSETLHGISKAFKLISYPKTIGYKKE